MDPARTSPRGFVLDLGGGMTGLDHWIAALGHGGSPLVVLAIAVLLGLRHATDPDHIVAVSTLVATEPERSVRRASVLGSAWGLGHATTLVAVGMPVVLLHLSFPRPVDRTVEAAIGVVIVALAVRLLARWRAGRFHLHPHAHGGRVHSHFHAHAASAHAHRHEIRSPLQACAIGLLHGAGGSAAVGLLLLATIPRRSEAAVALLVFAVGTGVSMAGLSSIFGFALGRRSVLRRFSRLAPALAVVSLVFGTWYGVGAVL